MYWIYLLRCADSSLYAGITTDPGRRLREHAGERPGGAKYTAAHPPVGFAALWQAEGRSAASRLEYRLKRLDHARKESLVRGEEIPGLLPEGCQRAGISIDSYSLSVDGDPRKE